MSGSRTFANTSTGILAPVTLTAGAGIVVVPAVTGQNTKLLYLLLTFSIAGTIQIQHGSSNWSGVMSVTTGVQYELDLHDNPWITAAGEGITITTVTAVGAGVVEYVQGNQ